MRDVVRLSGPEAIVGARAVAGNLRQLGLGVGDRIALCLPNQAEFQAAAVQIVMGALGTGIIPVMVNPALPDLERKRIFADADVALTCDSKAAVAALVEDSTHAIDISPVPLGRPMHYTSGTTGTSKGVHSGALDEATADALWGEEIAQWTFAADDVTLVHGPLAHSAPLRFSMLVLMAGGEVVFPGAFHAPTIAACLIDHQPTHAFLVPSHLQRLFTLPGGPPPSPYRLLTHAGTACPHPLKRQIHRWAGADTTWEFYGSTEGQFTACSGLDWESRPGTVGQARPGRTLTVDDGVIWCETPPWAHFDYWRDPEKTRQAWRQTAEGRQTFSVGDLGRLDGDGFLWLDGRRNDLIITGGVNVYPTQVENVLLEHPAVADVAVFGLEDARWGARVCAAVITDGSISDEELKRFARARLAGYQTPKDIHFVNELPMTASGKLRRTELPAFLNLDEQSKARP